MLTINLEDDFRYMYVLRNFTENPDVYKCNKFSLNGMQVDVTHYELHIILL